MKRWFVSGEVRVKGTEKPFLPHWESVNAMSSEHAITNYIACVALLKPEREIKKIYPPQLLGPANEEEKSLEATKEEATKLL